MYLDRFVFLCQKKLLTTNKTSEKQEQNIIEWNMILLKEDQSAELSRTVTPNKDWLKVQLPTKPQGMNNKNHPAMP